MCSKIHVEYGLIYNGLSPMKVREKPMELIGDVRNHNSTWKRKCNFKIKVLYVKSIIEWLLCLRKGVYRLYIYIYTHIFPI